MRTARDLQYIVEKYFFKLRNLVIFKPVLEEKNKILQQLISDVSAHLLNPAVVAHLCSPRDPD